MITSFQKLLITGAMLLIIVLIRIPFLSQPLVAEEANFAMLLTGSNANVVSIVDRPRHTLSSRCQYYVAKLNGVDYASTTDRNIFPYCFLSEVLNPATKTFRTDALSFDQKTTHVRMVFFAITLVGVISILLILFWSQYAVSIPSYFLLNVLLLYILTTPLLVGGSIQANLEGSIGVALFGLSALFSYAGAYQLKRYGGVFIFIAGLLISLGKNEWPLVVLLSILSYVALHLIIYRNESNVIKNNRQIYISIIYILGLLTGMLGCYLLSPQDYLDGYSLIKNIQSTRYSIYGLLQIVGHLLYPVIVLVIIVISILLFNLKKCLNEGVVLFSWWATGLGLFAGFLQSGWIGDGFPRYFIPAVVFLIAFLILTMKHVANTRIWFAFVILFIGLSLNSYSLIRASISSGSITSVPGLDVKRMRVEMEQLVKKNSENKNLIPFYYFGTRYYFPEADIINQAVGPSGATFIINKFGNPNMKIVEGSQ
jgi:hypothetical protein